VKAADRLRSTAAIVVRVQEGQVSSGSGRLRVLFFVDRPGVLRQYSSLVSELAARGHEVRLALKEVPADDRLRLVEGIVEGSDRVTMSAGPERGRLDGWQPVAWLVRGLGDLARYTHPRYDRAPVLRRRMTSKILGRLEKPGQFEPLGRRLALWLARRLVARNDAQLSRRVVRLAARLEAAIPTSSRIDRYIREWAPDVVLATSVVKPASTQVEPLKSARRLGIPAASCVASWDNLTNKGLLKFVPERVFVWNDVQRGEATELHGVPPDRVVATGAQLFDLWFERQPSTSRAEFVRRAGLDPAEPYVLFLGSSPFVTNHSDDEVRFVERWIEALRANGDERLRRLGIVIRPHPVGKGWRHAELGRFSNVAIWPPHSERPIAAEDQATFFDSLAHSAAVVGINTTAMIEAAIVGKSVLTVLAPEFAQESTLHFHHLLEENGGFLHVASSLGEHAEQLGRVLSQDVADEERRRRFVELFVRPRGLERPATPIFADAIEELARLPVERRLRPVTLLLRLPLALEAGLATAAIALRHAQVTRGLRRVRRRIGAQARRIGLLLPGSH
jgi:hypothetical protein